LGYDLHITRKNSWSDDEGSAITFDEWLAYIRTDNEVGRHSLDSEHKFLFTRGSFEWPLWWNPRLGEIYTKNPDETTIEKMVEIAKHLKARVLGDNAEEYPVVRTVAEEIEAGADWASRALIESAYRADFSPASLTEVDRFLVQESLGYVKGSEALLGGDLDVWAVGVYVGEVIRRASDKEWRWDAGFAQGDADITLSNRNEVVRPVHWVISRLGPNTQETIADRAAKLGLIVGRNPDTRWWKVW
jgi:hypothetical protein